MLFRSLVVSIIAAMEGSSEIAVGNVIGSNIANVGLVLELERFYTVNENIVQYQYKVLS